MEGENLACLLCLPSSQPSAWTFSAFSTIGILKQYVSPMLSAHKRKFLFLFSQLSNNLLGSLARVVTVQ